MRRRSYLLFLATVLTLLSSSAPAQGAAGRQGRSSDPDMSGEFGRELAEWRARSGRSWRLRRARHDADRMLYGGKRSASFRPRNRADYLRAAREFTREARGLLEIEDSTLRDGDVDFLALGTVGGKDKIAVRLPQEVRGVPVRGGAVNALMTADGELLTLSSSGLANTNDLDTRPTVSRTQAAGVAADDFRSRIGIAPNGVGEPTLVIVKEKKQGTLAWELELRFDAPGLVPDVWLYTVSAQGTPRVIDAENRVHDLDGEGEVRTFATPGLDPDTPSNPPVSVPLPFATVTSSAGTTTTDELGKFAFPGVSGPLSVSVSYTGPWVDVVNNSGSDHSMTQTVSGTGDVIELNASPNENTTAQANVFLGHNKVREFIHRLDPTDTTADFPVRANVNIADTCNAFFDGSSTNYFQAGGGCVNTGYSTVVAHEMGHFLNQLYGSGNGGDGFGEGAADVWAMYIYDTPVVGAGFVNGGFIRTGLNARNYCGDGNGACYGQVHTDGEPLGGALWKVRRNLNDTLGNDLGDATADALFLAWMAAFDQTTIDSVIELQWLILDDDDGRIENGTPHYAEIDAAFREQGFPGYDLPGVIFTAVTELEDGVDDFGPYGVRATVEALDSGATGDVTAVDLHYRSGATTGTVAMSPVSGSDEWLGLVPGFAAPAVIEYSFEAFTADAQAHAFPADDPMRFRVGRLERRVFEDFEGGVAGWTHRQIATQDDWHHDTPRGKSGTSFGVNWSDPSSAYSGTLAWGNDLGINGFNGAYATNVSNELSSPAFDLSDSVGTELRFQRWLTVEEGIYDRARIWVDDTLVWENPASGHLIDTAWTPVVLDISAAADGKSDVVVRFTLESDGGLELGGWNIDDFEITSLEPNPTACTPSSFGIGLAGTEGEPTLDAAGQQSFLGNGSFGLHLRGARTNAPAAIVFGSRQIALAWAGGTLLALPESIYPLETDVFGQARLPLAIPDLPSLLGNTYFAQGIVVDPLAPAGFALTNGLSMSPCDL